MIPTRRYTIDTSKTTQYSDAWVILALLVTLAGLLLRNAFLTTAAALLLVVAAVGWLWNRFSLRSVTYARRFSETRLFPGETAEMAIEVRNRKPLPLTWLVVRDSFPAGLPVDGRDLPANPASNLAEFTTFWMPGGRRRTTRRFLIAPKQRGIYRFGPARLESGDAFGFFESHATAPAQDRLIVYPHLYTADELALPTRSPFGPQRAAIPLYEDPLRPAGTRDWEPGDEMRRVHWKATARRQQLTSRVYEPSEELQVEIVLNVTTMPRHWQGVHVELHERAVSVAASLAALAIEQRLPTGLIANGSMPGSDQPLRLLPGRSENQLLHILEMLAAVTHFATDPIEVLLEREAARLPWGVTLLLVTAITHADLLAAVRDLAAGRRRIVLVTLAERPPTEYLGPVEVYHLPHLVDDLIRPLRA